MKQLRKRIPKEKFIELYNSMDNISLSEKLKCSRQAIVSYAKKLNLLPKKIGRKRIKKLDYLSKKVLKQVYYSKTTHEAADELGVSVSVLLKEIKKRGIKTKTKK